jgi:hypothetical protein
VVSQRPPVAYPIDPAGVRHRPIPYTSAVLVPRHLAVGRWSLTAKLNGTVLDVLDGGWRVVFDGGPMPGYGGYVDRAEIALGSDSDTRSVPMITLSGPDDMTILAERLAYPDPTSVATDQDAQAYDRRSAAQASTVILQYIQRNAGHLAITGRSAPAFSTAITDPLVGGPIAAQARFSPLLSEIVAPLAEQAGLRVWITSTTAGQRTLQIAAVRDLTGKARFSIALRNLRSLKYELTAPTATYVVGGGRGEETARMFKDANNSGAAATWRRIEGFYDYRSARDDDSGVELQAGTDKRLAEAAAREQVDVVPIDTERLRFGVDYGIGDRGLAEVGFGTGLKVVATIREAEITISRQSDRATVQVKPKASTVAVTGRLRSDRALLDLLGRVGRLERR